MKRAVWLVLGASLIGGGIAGAIGGCSSDEPPPDEQPDSGEPSSTSGDPGSSGSSGRGTSGGTSSSGGPTDDLDAGDEGDGGSDASPNPVTSNPGKITCGATECDAGTGRCCWPEIDASAAICAGNCQGNNTFEVLCDEKADCANENQRCCLFFGESRCAVNCAPGGNVQLCKTDAECLNDAGCSEKSCTRGVPPDQVVLRLRVCGTPAGCQ